MKKRDIRFASIPSTEEVAAERERLAYQSRYQRVLRSTIYILVVVAAVAVLLATLFLPVLQVSGDSRVVSRAPATSAGPTYFCHWVAAGWVVGCGTVEVPTLAVQWA